MYGSQNAMSNGRLPEARADGARSVRMCYTKDRLFGNILVHIRNDFRDAFGDNAGELEEENRGHLGLALLNEVERDGFEIVGPASYVVFQLESYDEQQRFLELLDSWKKVDWCHIAEEWLEPGQRLSWDPNVRKEVQGHSCPSF
ncbi:unnamed protein product [Amoebophrya sp. A25]|nr:unnamed protein product [Amoebophrya sp. A25]|eukprot:GSA25T00000974001.1